MEACLVVLQGSDADPALPEPVYTPQRTPLFGIREALVRVRAQLATLTEPGPLETFLPRKPAQAHDRTLLARLAVGSAFFATLERGRGGRRDRRDSGTVRPASGTRRS